MKHRTHRSEQCHLLTPIVQIDSCVRSAGPCVIVFVVRVFSSLSREKFVREDKPSSSVDPHRTRLPVCSWKNKTKGSKIMSHHLFMLCFLCFVRQTQTMRGPLDVQRSSKCVKVRPCGMYGKCSRLCEATSSSATPSTAKCIKKQADTRGPAQPTAVRDSGRCKNSSTLELHQVHSTVKWFSKKLRSSFSDHVISRAFTCRPWNKLFIVRTLRSLLDKKPFSFSSLLLLLSLNQMLHREIYASE